MHIDEASDFILESLFMINRGEILIPKIKEFKIKELALKISSKHKIIGIRGKEKLGEVLLSDDEKSKAHETKNMWIVKP